MKAFIQGLIALIVVATLGISLAPAGTIPQPFSTLPYTYDGIFPAGQLNTNFGYTLSYTDTVSAVLTPQSWQLITVSQVAVAGNNLAVNTAASAISITLPTPSSDATTPLDTIRLMDATNSFASHNMTILSASGVNLNSVSGSPASAVYATSGVQVECQYLNSTIGYNCGVR
jgi:hypothetical protein